MATVSKWTPFGVALNITATKASVTRTSATKYTVKINASWKVYYSGSSTNYGMTASSGGGSATINKFGTYASSGSGSFTGTYSISGNGSATKTITVTFKNFNSDNGDSATKTVRFDVTVPAWISYTVTYNANGGSLGNVPKTQTKWKDQTLTLSGSKPTRSGYTFVGWGTSTTDTSANYSAGGSYTANASDTLYAIWKKTITLTYNVNGGNSGTGPSAQSATVYNATTSYKFTIPATKPTKSGYVFVGWSTSSTATSASYAAGGSITLSASGTLYAIWKKTITLTYNANGGSKAPSAQSATVYNATTSSKFTIPAAEPTLTDYKFLGWSTSETATSATYNAGDNIILSASDILYAVWELVYVQPRIDELDVKRYSPGVDQYYIVEFNSETNEYTRSDTIIESPDGGVIVVDAYTIDGYAVWSITDDSDTITYYCMVEGAEWIANDEGTYACVEFEYQCDKALSSIVIAWSSVSGESGSISLSPLPSSPVQQIIGDGNLSSETEYDITITVTDENGYSEKHITIPGTKFAMDVMPECAGVCFGGPAEIKDAAEFKYTIKPTKGYTNITLPNNKDFDEVTVPNTYVGYNISKFINVPEGADSGHSFTLYVDSAGIAGQLKQTLVTCSEGYMGEFVRFYYSNTWHKWTQTFKNTSGGDLLWDGNTTPTGGYFMNEGQSIKLSQPISYQPHGIVLIFCRYVDGAGQPHNFNSFFVPKMLVSLHSGCGSCFQMNTVDYNAICSKYLYIRDSTIAGNANNQATGTRNGVTFANNAYVLRYVIGV